MRILKRISGFLIICLLMFFTSCNKEKVVKKGELFLRLDQVNEAVQNNMLELALFEKELKIESFGNPYDYNYLRVEATFTSPTNKITSVNAFWYQDYNIVLNTMGNFSPSGISGVASTNPDEVQGLELVNPVGDPHYRIRFTPNECGKYHLVIKTYKEGKLYSTEFERDIEVTSSNKKLQSVVEVDDTNKRTFRLRDTKETFIPIGENACWYTSSTRKTEDYRVWFSNMKDVGMNTTRIWMATWGFALHWGEAYDNYSSRYAQSARMDKMVSLAEEYGIYFMLTLNNHGQFSYTVNPEWENSPWNSSNGGILDKPHEFFTNDKAKAAYKNELLYIIARYGYSSNILCFELFNEVDWVDSYQMFSLYVKKWHQEMASFIKENDPLHHMVSTSYKGTDGTANSLDEIDFVSPHDYGYSSKKMIEGIMKTQTDLSKKYNKPVFFGEVGLNGQNGLDTYNQDKTGITLHQGSWSGMMGSGCGSAMPWWWDSYVHPNNLYYRFTGASKFSQNLDLTGSDYTLIQDSNYNIDNSNVQIMGYKFNNRMYGYLYDKAWTFRNTSLVKKRIIVEIPFTNGTYTLSVYDTSTGDVILTKKITVSNNTLKLENLEFTYDLAFIIN